MHKFKTNDQNGKRRPTSGLTIEFNKDAIELIVKIKILIEDWIAQIKH
jgi:hypothetical protein